MLRDIELKVKNNPDNPNNSNNPSKPKKNLINNSLFKNFITKDQGSKPNSSNDLNSPDAKTVEAYNLLFTYQTNNPQNDPNYTPLIPANNPNRPGLSINHNSPNNPVVSSQTAGSENNMGSKTAQVGRGKTIIDNHNFLNLKKAGNIAFERFSNYIHTRYIYIYMYWPDLNNTTKPSNPGDNTVCVGAV